MSEPASPNEQRRNAQIHPALHPSVTAVPVTPGVSLAGRSNYIDPGQPRDESNDSQDPGSTKDGIDTNFPQGSQASANSYFGCQQSDANEPVQTSGREAAGKPTPQEGLDGAGGGGLVPSRKDSTVLDPRTDYPGLNLSGSIISATTYVPYDLGYLEGHEWELKPRRGTSALFDSLSYLASPASPWNHCLVAWTGEIKAVTKQSSNGQSSNRATVNIAPINKAAAPVPVNSKEPNVPDIAVDGIQIPRSDRDRLARQLEREHGGRVVPVWLPDDYDEEADTILIKDQARWRRYADRELYTLFHYKNAEPTDGRAARKWWADYYKMNKLFADCIMETYKPGDVVVVHDYSLMLLPSLLRQRVPNMYISFILHIPFPSSEYYRCLSRRKEILEGILGANMVGFQSYSYARHFSSCCTRILAFESSSAGVDVYGAHVAVDVFPIGISAVATLRAAFGDSAVADKLNGIRELYNGKKLIVGRDRLDSVRGVYQKLQAFELFLEKYPDWREKVVLVQITSPANQTADHDEDDVKFINKISDLVARINGGYGSLSFTPVQHFPQYLSREEYFALLRVADIGLITSVRDGMNTTALEYVVCQRDNYGPLIISEFSGTASSLADAIHVNPWDLGGVADAIDRALRMPTGERVKMGDALYKHVIANDVEIWTQNYLRHLLTSLSSADQSTSTPSLDLTMLLSQYRDAKKRLFMFDYDGTLTPIVRDPQAAIPSDRVLRTLKTLAADPNNSVWIISGRDQAFLDEWMGHIPTLGLSAEHGCFMRPPESQEWINLAEKADMAWQQEVEAVFQQYTDRTSGSFIERKKVALTWHYRRADPEYGAFQARECQRELDETVARKYDVEVMTGKANVEVRPRFVNKGEIAKRLVKDYAKDLEFVLCMGDDFTDEDMFRALRSSKVPSEHVFTVTVGASSKQTLATWHLLEPSDVISCLALLNGNADMGSIGAVSVVDGAVPESRRS